MMYFGGNFLLKRRNETKLVSESMSDPILAGTTLLGKGFEFLLFVLAVVHLTICLCTFIALGVEGFWFPAIFYEYGYLMFIRKIYVSIEGEKSEKNK